MSGVRASGHARALSACLLCGVFGQAPPGGHSSRKVFMLLLFGFFLSEVGNLVYTGALVGGGEEPSPQSLVAVLEGRDVMWPPETGESHDVGVSRIDPRGTARPQA